MENTGSFDNSFDVDSFIKKIFEGLKKPSREESDHKENIPELGFGLTQRCLRFLELPTSPVGKTANIIVGKSGQRLDDSMGGNPKTIKYNYVMDRMGMILAVDSYINPGKHWPVVWLNLFIAKSADYRGNEHKLNLMRVSQKFYLTENGLSLFEDWMLFDDTPSIDDIREEKIKIIFRILE